MIDNHIVPALGSAELQKLTPTMLQKYYADKIRAGKISSNTVRKHHDLMNTAFQMAVKQGLILSNPAANVEAPTVKRAEIKYYSIEQLQTLLKLSEGTRLEVLIKLAGLLGLRHSFASVANSKGIPMYDIGKALGHSSPSTTSRVYTHLLDRDHAEMLKKMWE